MPELVEKFDNLGVNIVKFFRCDDIRRKYIDHIAEWPKQYPAIEKVWIDLLSDFAEIRGI